ncbi:MAG: S-methyl-5-thioribose-1-phosphate isomerase [Candidatus Omnitrophota bacterium]
MKYETIRWKNDNVELIDQRLLPLKEKYVVCRTIKDMWFAIKDMKLRGAPAIGIAGAYGLYLGVRGSKTKNFQIFKKEIDKCSRYLGSARPTARNLFWALERAAFLAKKNKQKPVSEIKKLMLKEAHLILKEDWNICRAIGQFGAKLIKNKSSVLTHCNAGGLATSGYGTALGVIFAAKKKIYRVFVDETRPWLQGARLTAWELTKAKVPAVLICDNMAAALMAKGEVDAVIVGADRIARNGDTANKIGTYSLAVSANYHNVPFYVAAPVSTFDLSIGSGKEILIEERCGSEVKKINGRYVTVKDIQVKNPAFDVTPAKLITVIITEKGIIKKPNKKKITEMIK